MDNLTIASQWAIVFSGFYLWIGMLTGIWKYYQIRHSERAKAHYYVDIAHRSSLLYAAASLILAMLSQFTVLPNHIALLCVLANLIFFTFAILSYILHGLLQDTANQFKQPHKLGRWILPSWCMTLAMLLLIIAEFGATSILLLGTVLKFLT